MATPLAVQGVVCVCVCVCVCVKEREHARAPVRVGTEIVLLRPLLYHLLEIRHTQTLCLCLCLIYTHTYTPQILHFGKTAKRGSFVICGNSITKMRLQMHTTAVTTSQSQQCFVSRPACPSSFQRSRMLVSVSCASSCLRERERERERVASGFIHW